MRLEFNNIDELEKYLKILRSKIEKGFGSDTALSGTAYVKPSSGQCAAVAVILKSLLGGDLLSTKIEDESHWFNRINLLGNSIEIDLTGDQFDFSPIQIKTNEQLYNNAKLRSLSEVNIDTWERAKKLARKAKITFPNAASMAK